MQKGQRIDKHAESWDQLVVLDSLMEMHNSLVAFLLLFFYFASFLYSLKSFFFSIL
jgi:hypothetical protein